ncbi:pentatricopeptide repeat-containing protein At2g13600-like [Macadamia integrifolia]|uniref:pentatricopeptide repeat-containing protein At2g13600-like n=1 Tax=Macadamia integrifolia TaxID=60698 RepID=UPI001C4EF2A5|nr:pentatricopeptide repeat-containing protein At2g13600-like [Macadamia integrifolia]
MKVSLRYFPFSRKLHQGTWQKFGLFPHQFLPNFSSSTLNTSVTNKLEKTIASLIGINPRTAFVAYAETCVSVLKILSTHGFIREGRAFHGHFIKMGISSDRYISVKLLIMYLNCKINVDVEEILREFGGFDIVAWNCMITARVQQGNLQAALQLFDEMPERNEVTWTALIAGFMQFGRVDDSLWYFERNPFQNVVSWTAVISGFVRDGSNVEALNFFCKMLEHGTKPNNVTFTSILGACIGLGDLKLGRNILGLIVKLGFEDNLSVCNALITFYVRMGEFDLAWRVFDRMESRDVISWTAILDLYVEMGDMLEARRIFDEMPERNEVSWSAMIARYSQGGDAKEALKLFVDMLRDGFRPNLSCYSSILSALGSIECLRLGTSIHGDVIKIGIERNVFIGGPLIDMYCKCGQTADGRLVFELISEKNLVCWNSMVAGYGLNGQLEEAKELFEQIPRRNSISWNTMISGYVQNEHCHEVLEVFNQMLLSGETPNESTFSSVLRACSSLACLEKGKNLHGKIIKLGIQYELFVGTALTDMYAKSGDIESSKQVLNKMPEKNEVSWTAMIQGLADNGLAEDSLNLFDEMERTSNVAPSGLMFLAVLFACSHFGLVEKGFKYFESMEKVYGIKPTGRHYTCIVDLLARSGHLREAENFIKAMPFQPEANAWAALLSGCSVYKNEEIAERTAKKIWELLEENSAGYVLLSNIYASAERWSDVSRVRKLMREKGLKKIGGCSWIEVRNQVHSFYSDGSHSHLSDIVRILELLMSEMMVASLSGEFEVQI